MIALPEISTYAKPAEKGSQFAKLYSTQPEGLGFPWLFLHRDNAPKGAVHALPIIKKGDQRFVRLLVNKCPALGNQLCIGTPSGLVGDDNPSESALEAARKEVDEETGYSNVDIKALANNFFPSSPGCTTERKGFFIATADGEPNAIVRDEGEAFVIQGPLDVPLETFVDYKKFQAWLKEMETKGIHVGLDVIAARGLLPIKGGKLDLVA
jgi:8-oxo-dGTP pyrophosphatase MutT (NUDIX family)